MALQPVWTKLILAFKEPIFTAVFAKRTRLTPAGVSESWLGGRVLYPTASKIRCNWFWSRPQTGRTPQKLRPARPLFTGERDNNLSIFDLNCVFTIAPLLFVTTRRKSKKRKEQEDSWLYPGLVDLLARPADPSGWSDCRIRVSVWAKSDLVWKDLSARW